MATTRRFPSAVAARTSPILPPRSWRGMLIDPVAQGDVCFSKPQATRGRMGRRDSRAQGSKRPAESKTSRRLAGCPISRGFLCRSSPLSSFGSSSLPALFHIPSSVRSWPHAREKHKKPEMPDADQDSRPLTSYRQQKQRHQHLGGRRLQTREAVGRPREQVQSLAA